MKQGKVVALCICPVAGAQMQTVEEDADFKEMFQDRGGLIAQIIVGGIIRVGDAVIPPPKAY